MLDGVRRETPKFFSSMNEISLVEALRATLDDARLSRGEKRAVRAMVQRQLQSKHQHKLLRSQAFDLAREAMKSGSHAEAMAILEWLEDVVKAIEPADDVPQRRRSEAYFAPEDDCPHRLITLLASCRKSADICVFTITDDSVTEAIMQAKDRGAAVRIISDDHKSNDPGSDIRRLRNRGIAVRVDPTPHHMHHKFAVVDGETLVTGSYNWTRSASRGNFENLVLLTEPRLVSAFAEEFERLWGVCYHV